MQCRTRPAFLSAHSCIVATATASWGLCDMNSPISLVGLCYFVVCYDEQDFVHLFCGSRGLSLGQRLLAESMQTMAGERACCWECSFIVLWQGKKVDTVPVNDKSSIAPSTPRLHRLSCIFFYPTPIWYYARSVLGMIYAGSRISVSRLQTKCA
jgi:hypothetical protein